MLDMGRPKEEILKEMSPRERGNGNNAPEGGISIRAASKKYGIPASTLSYRRQKGWIETLKETPNEVFILEEDVAKLRKALPKNTKRGSKEITRYLEKSHALQQP